MKNSNLSLLDQWRTLDTKFLYTLIVQATNDGDLDSLKSANFEPDTYFKYCIKAFNDREIQKIFFPFDKDSFIENGKYSENISYAIKDLFLNLPSFSFLRQVDIFLNKLSIDSDEEKKENQLVTLSKRFNSLVFHLNKTIESVSPSSYNEVFSENESDNGNLNPNHFTVLDSALYCDSKAEIILSRKEFDSVIISADANFKKEVLSNNLIFKEIISLFDLFLKNNRIDLINFDGINVLKTSFISIENGSLQAKEGDRLTLSYLFSLAEIMLNLDYTFSLKVLKSTLENVLLPNYDAFLKTIFILKEKFSINIDSGNFNHSNFSPVEGTIYLFEKI